MGDAARPAPLRGLEARRFEREVTRAYSGRYLLFLPEGYGSDGSERLWPLILFLHGAGERGEDLAIVAEHGLLKVAQGRRDFPFVVAAPQCPERETWQAELLIALLDELVSSCAIDETRVYLTGLSMGGYGAWQLAARHPERFAAVAPICGGARPTIAGALKELPVWAFHSVDDPVVPVQESVQIVTKLREVGGQVRFTVYPDGGHDAWTRTYEDPELYEWFLSHGRGERK